MRDTQFPEWLDEIEAEFEAACVDTSDPVLADDMLGRAYAALHAAGDCRGHLMVRGLTADAADALYAAAHAAPQPLRSNLLRLSQTLNDELDRAAFYPHEATLVAVMDEAGRIRDEMREGST